MPLFGLGVFQTKPGSETESAVGWAVEAGYCHIDTAAAYGNEQGVGKALRAAGVADGDVFVTTKVGTKDLRAGTTREAFEKSVRNLGTDTVDLLLIHWPVGDYVAAWKVMEELYAAGRIRAIGVSNFLIHHLEQLLAEAQVVPMVNQFEFHPHLQQPALVDFCLRHAIQVEAWAPIMRGAVNDIPELVEIGQAHGKNAVQATVRWLLQRGIVTIPKSSRRQRIIDNADVFDFELSAAEIARIDALDRAHRLGAHPDHITF